MHPFFVYALGDFLVLFVPVLRQIARARYLPHHRTKMTQKLIPNHHTINSKQLLIMSLCPVPTLPARCGMPIFHMTDSKETWIK